MYGVSIILYSTTTQNQPSQQYYPLGIDQKILLTPELADISAFLEGTYIGQFGG